MTIEELRKIHSDYVLAHLEQGNGNAVSLDAMREVVRALRDELSGNWIDCSHCDTNAKLFREILASDGVEAAAELPKPQTRTVPLTGITKTVRPDVVFEPDAPAAAPIRDAVARARGRTLAVDDIPTLNKIAAAMRTPAAAPDVCVWAKESNLWTIGCDPLRFPSFVPSKKICKHCNRPISFKEAANEQ